MNYAQGMEEFYKEYPKLRAMNRIRLLSPWAFRSVLERIRSREQDSFRRWFDNSTYDFPKLIDAIIRLRSIDSNCPVLRFDHDVLFSPESYKDSMGKVRSLVLNSIAMFRKRRNDTHALTWYFSGHYVDENLQSVDGRKTWKNWCGAFATRANPALLCTTELVNIAQFRSKNADWIPDDTVLNAAVDESLMRRFYGLADTRGELATMHVAEEFETDVLSLGTAVVGANPLRSCVSGAGLCVSSSVTIDLPPFGLLQNK